MPIDWTTRDRALSLAYLFEGTYHDENGMERMVHWCGPKNRVGSGLSVPVPFYPGQRETFTPVWEARLTRASMDLNMGNIDQTIGVVSDMTFNVDMSGGSQAAEPVAGDLLRDVVYGRWKNKECRVWLLDLETGDTQIMGKGTLDRNPSSIGPGTFQVVMDITPVFPADLAWPQGEIPIDTDGYTFDAAGALTHLYVPEQFMFNPDHAGRFLGLAFGDASIAGDDYVWKELIPYGRQVKSGTEHWVYAWVSPQKNCFVEDLYWENTLNGNEPIQVLAHSISTFENVNPTMGPLGTCVRFVVTSNASFSFIWWSPSGGAKARAVARVDGSGSGQHSTFAYDDQGGNPISVYAQTGAARASVWEIIGDVITRPELLGLSGALGSNALSDFQSTIPFVSNASYFASMACVVPRDPTDRPVPAREAFGALARFFPFDFAQRYDETTQDWRLYPVWRSSFSSTPTHIFTVSDMSRTDAPAVAQYDNADGKYANQVFVNTPAFYGEPTIASASSTSGGENNLFPVKMERFQHNDPFEQAPEREGAVVVASLTMDHWLHYGTPGNSSAAWALGEERSQPQRTVQATHGVRSFRVGMGVSIEYNMVGINSDVGMVRKMRYDFDLQQVQITSYHIDHSTRRGKPRGDNVSDNSQRGEVPDV